MVFNSSQLRNSGRPIRVSSDKVIRYLTYATNDAKADVLAPGYFNNARVDLSIGTIIEAEVACSSAQERVRMRVATMPVGGNITTALAQGGGGGDQPPAGFAWLTDFEGNAVYDFENNRMYGAI